MSLWPEMLLSIWRTWRVVMEFLQGPTALVSPGHIQPGPMDCRGEVQEVQNHNPTIKRLPTFNLCVFFLKYYWSFQVSACFPSFWPGTKGLPWDEVCPPGAESCPGNAGQAPWVPPWQCNHQTPSTGPGARHGLVQGGSLGKCKEERISGIMNIVFCLQ